MSRPPGAKKRESRRPFRGPRPDQRAASRGEASTGRDVEICHNDIRHHQQYVNGYALAVRCPSADVHHNRITSIGRAAHLTGEGIRLHDNWIETRGHMTLDDIPAKSRPFKHQRVELHGIKLEGSRVRRCQVFRNRVRLVQSRPEPFDPWRSTGEPEGGKPGRESGGKVYVRSRATRVTAARLVDPTRKWETDRWKGYLVAYDRELPPATIEGNDATTLRGRFRATEPGEYAVYVQWDWVPATPLNIACYSPDAMNEIHDNTFIALTEHRDTRHGGYGDSGRWACALWFVGMTRGPAPTDRYSVLIRDNRFVSNDLFVGGRATGMSIRIERNSFSLAKNPPPTREHRVFRGVGPDVQRTVREGANTFEGMAP